METKTSPAATRSLPTCFAVRCQKVLRHGDKVERSIWGALYHSECLPAREQSAQSGWMNYNQGTGR